MKVYFISGLAADSRVFKHIRLPEKYQPVYLDWIKANKNESLESYALRLAKKIDMNEKFILGVIVCLIFLIGVYPQPVLDLTKDTVAAILERLK